MTVGIIPLASSALASSSSSEASAGGGGSRPPGGITDDLLAVLGAISTDVGDLSTVRYCTTRRFTPSDLAASQIPAIGVWEEQIEESYLASLKRDCVLTVRIVGIVQAGSEDRARELRDFLRRDINFRLFADQSRSGFAYQTDGESTWVLSTFEQPQVLAMERVMTIRFREPTSSNAATTGAQA